MFKEKTSIYLQFRGQNFVACPWAAWPHGRDGHCGYNQQVIVSDQKRVVGWGRIQVFKTVLAQELLPEDMILGA